MTDPSRRALIGGALALGVATSLPANAAAPDAKAARRGTLIVNGLDPSARTTTYLDMLEAGGVHCWHQSVGGGIGSFGDLFAFCDANAKRIGRAGSVRDIRRLHAEGRIAHVAGWQSAEPLIVDGEPRPADLRGFHELGLRICGIAYNDVNEFGGGCFDPDVRLTRAGRRLVEDVHRNRILLDVGGHTNEKTSFDALAISAGVPVVCSHTNIRALNDNPRCSTDRFLEAIAKTGGVIGLSAVNDFHARRAADRAVPVTPQVGLDRHLDQFDYLKRLVGVDHIGLGPDFIEGRNPPGPLSAEDRILMAAEAYSQVTPWFYVKGFEKISELPNVTAGLVARGWTEAEIGKVLGGNWLRVYEQVWGA